MKNFIQKGDVLDLVIAAGCSSGDPVMVGGLGGVAATDISPGASGPVKTLGVFDLPVKAVDKDGNSAVAIGDPIYFVSGDTPKLSKKSTGSFFGYAMEVITSSQTDTIRVFRVPYPGPGTSDILTAGVIVGSMLAANIAIAAPDITEGVSPHDYGAAHADWTLSTAEKKSKILTVSNADQAVNAIATPAAGKVYIVENGSGQALTFKAEGQTGVTIASTKTAQVRGNGTDFVRVTADA